jgi:hypothetical protein
MTGRSRVISCHSRDIGVDCLLFCNYYKDHGRDYVQYHDLEWYPSMLINWIRPQYMVVVVKCLKILATYRKYGTQ